MEITGSGQIPGLSGQKIKPVESGEVRDTVIYYSRGRRFVPMENRTGLRRIVTRQVRIRDLPVLRLPVVLLIEYCQLKLSAAERRMEHLPFGQPGHGFTQPYALFAASCTDI